MLQFIHRWPHAASACFFGFILALVCQGCRQHDTGISTGTMTVHRVSLLRLIAAPKEYQGRVVYVAGYLVLEHEGDALYLDELQYKHQLLNNGLWLETNTTDNVDWPKFNKQYVEVLATFGTDSSSDQTLYSGKLREVRGVSLIPNPPSP